VDEDNCIIRSFISFTENQMLLRWSNKRGLDGQVTWQAFERKEMPAVRGEFGKHRVSCENYIKMVLNKIARDTREGIHTYQNKDMWRALVTKVPKFLVLYKSNFFLISRIILLDFQRVLFPQY
jgi:hypothetical protein